MDRFGRKILARVWIALAIFQCLSAISRGEASPDRSEQANIRGNILSGMAFIPGGTFLMGSEQGDPNEQPVHRVTVLPFYLNSCEVTCREFQEFLRENPQWLRENRVNRFSTKQYLWRRCYLHDWDGFDFPAGCGGLPVTGVDWAAAAAFADWVGGRLPSEAEWEFAARGGLEGRRYPWGDEIDRTKANYLEDQAWIEPYVKKESKDSFEIVSGGPNQTNPLRPPGSYSPNRFGLYDMAGNAWEWCRDWYGKEYYRMSPPIDPPGPSDGEYHVVRGGSHIDFRFNLRCATRFFVVDGWNIGRLVGFRVAMSPEQFSKASGGYDEALGKKMVD